MTDRRLSLEKFFSLAREMLCIAGTDGRFKLVNPAFERTLGWSTEELLSRPFYDFVHPDDLEATQDEVEKLSRGIPTISFENRYRCADGTYRVLQWTAQPDPERGLLYSAARDVTEQKRTQAELVEARDAAEAADRAKSLFLASMSHELRTPLNGVLGATDLLLERIEDDDLVRYLEIVRQSSETLLELLEDVLEYSKIEAGRIELLDEPFNLREVVAASVRTLSVLAQRKQLELVVRVARDVPDRLLGDAGRLRQILTNLVANAVKYTDRGEIRIEAGLRSRDADGVVLEIAVHDTGVGIAPGDQKLIFERFRQAEAAAKLRGGAGLGLAITSQLVHLMGGAIELESEPRRGSTFRFTARLALDPAEPETTAAARPLEGKRALVVDDNQTALAALAELLEDRGARVSATDSAGEALAAIEQSTADPFDVVLIDCHQPANAGVELVESVCALEPRPPIIALIHSVRRAGSLRRCRELGVSAALLKPVLEPELDEALAAAFGAAPPAPPPRLARAPQRSIEPLHVLVVEDGEFSQEVARGLLEGRGHRVRIAETGTEGIRLFRAEEPDLVLMDLQLPDLDGTEVAARMRAEEGRRGRVPIVAMTAHTTPEARERCLAAGMDDFLAKPLRAAHLDALLERIVKAPRRATHRIPGAGSPEWRSALDATGGNPRLLRRLMEAAYDEIPDLSAAIEEALDSGDCHQAKIRAHTLKGTIRYFGTADQIAAVERVERAAAEGRLDDARQECPALRTAAGEIVEKLQGAIDERKRAS